MELSIMVIRYLNLMLNKRIVKGVCIVETKKYSALDIAKYTITKCTIDKCPVTNLHLQKILYFLQKDHLEKCGDCLFDDEIQAWQFGPVVPDVYYQYCGFGSSAITMTYEIDIDDVVKRMIDPIIEAKREMYPWDLVAETHALGKAWDRTYRNGEGNRCVISPELIKKRG